MKTIKLLLGVMLLSAPVYAEVMDRIVAVVDKQIILESELNSQLQLYAMQTRTNLSNEAVRNDLKSQILDRMIEDKVLLVQAERDTSISVNNKEVEEALSNQIERIKAQFPSEEVFQNQLRAEGLTLKELRNQYRDEVRNQILKEKFIQKRLEKVRVSSGEVNAFYEANRDSLPSKPAGVRLAHILISAMPGQATRDSLFNFANQIRKKALEGEDFALLARTYSQDPGAENGGDLGWFARGAMVPDFEKAAFDLQPGQISDVIETEFGLHIIKSTGKKDDQARASHILIQVQPTEEDLESRRALADSIYGLIENGADFATLAKGYSDDENSRDSGGEIGWYGADDLLPSFRTALEDLDVGAITPPVRSDFGYHIIKLEEKRESTPIDPKEDYETLSEMARRDKTQKQLSEWIARISSGLYIDKRL